MNLKLLFSLTAFLLLVFSGKLIRGENDVSFDKAKKQTREYEYLIRFESTFTFDPDSLVALVARNIDGADLPRHVRVPASKKIRKRQLRTAC